MPRSLSTSSLSCGPRPMSAISLHSVVWCETASGCKYQELFIVPRLRYGSGQLQEPVAQRALAMVDMCHDAKISVTIDRYGANSVLYGGWVHEHSVCATGCVAQPSQSPQIEGSARGLQTGRTGRRASGPDGVSRRHPRDLRPEERPSGSNGWWRGDHLFYHVRSASITKGSFASVSGFVHLRRNQRSDIRLRGSARAGKWDYAGSRGLCRRSLPRLMAVKASESVGLAARSIIGRQYQSASGLSMYEVCRSNQGTSYIETPAQRVSCQDPLPTSRFI